MIVYVESNFLLELAYRQERSVSCGEMLRMARENAVRLVLPAFCVAEARATWRRRVSERQEFHSRFRYHLRGIARSERYRALNDQFEEISDALVSGTPCNRTPSSMSGLTAMGCKVIVNFDDAIAYLRNAFRTETQS